MPLLVWDTAYPWRRELSRTWRHRLLRLHKRQPRLHCSSSHRWQQFQHLQPNATKQRGIHGLPTDGTSDGSITDNPTWLCNQQWRNWDTRDLSKHTQSERTRLPTTASPETGWRHALRTRCGQSSCAQSRMQMAGRDASPSTCTPSLSGQRWP